MKKKYIYIGISLLLVGILFWIIWSNVTVGVTYFTVTSKSLPEDFNEFKIAVLSDFHNAHFSNDNEKIINIIKDEQPDMIAITGDLIDSNRTDVETAVMVVKKLTQISPCYYVTGNHESRVREEYEKLESELLANGVVILHDASVQIEKGNGIIQIAGLDDPSFSKSYANDFMAATKLNNMQLEDGFKILLSHRPELFDEYVYANMNLVLSGHAHGGQIRLPFVGGLVAPNQGFFPKYDAGLFEEDNTVMIVSKGVGNSIFPVRINDRPEIVVVEITCD